MENESGKNIMVIGKSLVEIIKIADEKKFQVVLIGEGAIDGARAALMATMSKRHDVIMVNIADLPISDQKRVMDADKIQDIRPSLPFDISKIEPISIVITAPEQLPEVFIKAQKKPWEVSKQRKKLKGYQKRK